MCMHHSQDNKLLDVVKIRELRRKCGERHWVRNALDSQSRLKLDGGSDTIDPVSVGDDGVLLAGVVAE